MATGFCRFHARRLLRRRRRSPPLGPRRHEFAAEVVFDRPDRFGSFATPTLPGVDGALAEAEYALDALHADGIVLPANNDGSYPGDSGFDPLLRFLHDRQGAAFIHPGNSDATRRPARCARPSTAAARRTRSRA